MRRFFRTHIRPLVVGACVVAIAAVGLTIALVSGGSGRTASASPTTSPTTAPLAAQAPAAGTTSTHAKPHVRGTIASIGSATWTITTAKGRTLTVQIGATTVFGTKKAPLAASSFATGQTVVVFGTRHGTTVTATRIVVARTAGAGSAATTPTTVTTPTTAAA